MNIDENYTFVQSMVNAAFSGIGFALAMVIFSGVRSRVEDADGETPQMFRGVPATLVAAAIVSMSFLGFGGLGQ
jgi:electron transport complex protein RnfA